MKNFSICIATRDNIPGLKSVIKSLLNNCKKKSDIEFLFTVNKDDFRTIKFLHSLKFLHKNFRVFYMSANHNYFDAAERLNLMSEKSRGKYVFFINDDMVMKSKNWDIKYLNFIKSLDKNRIFITYPKHNQKNHNWPTSAIIPKKWINITGKVSNSFEADTELYIISTLLGKIYKINNIKIHHHGGIKIKKKQFNWKSTRYKLIKQNLKHPNSIFTLNKLFLALIDYEKLSYFLKKKKISMILIYMKIIFLLFFYLQLIQKKTNLNFFQILLTNLNRKNF